MSWNVQGLANKIDDSNFRHFCELYDIFGFQETMACNTELFCNYFTDYMCYESVRDKSELGITKASGGVSVFVKTNIAQHVTHVRTNDIDCVSLYIESDIFGNGKATIITFVYIPPIDSIMHNLSMEQGLDGLENKFSHMLNNYNDCNLFLAGDLNARIGTVNDCIMQDDTCFIPGLEGGDEYVSDNFNIPRNSKDSTVNTFGYDLIDMCHALSVHVLNGRVTGDEQGEFTHVSRQGASVIDYMAVSSDMFTNVKHFTVIDRQESDHFPIQCTLQVTLPGEREVALQVDRSQHKLVRYRWKEIHRDEFVNTVNDVDIDALNIDDPVMDEEVDGLIDKLNTVFYSAGQAMEVKGNSTKRDQPDWYDSQCEREKHEVNYLLNRFRATSDREVLSRYLDAKCMYKHTCKSKKKLVDEKHCAELCGFATERNCTAFWKKVKYLISGGKHTSKSESISGSEWFLYFSDLLNSDNAHDVELSDFDAQVQTFSQSHKTGCQQCEDMNIHNVLNTAITEEEVTLATSKLKNGKSTGTDGIPGEFYRYSLHKLYPIFVKLFNNMFKHGVFPAQWTEGVIVPIHKKGDKNDPGNYRGITLLNIAGTFFTTILNTRLKAWSEDTNAVEECQSGFRNGYSTTDNIFVLQCVAQKYLDRKKSKFYCAFIDFSKAFDTVNRTKLWYILIRKGIHGKMINILENMYAQVKSSVRIGKCRTSFFDTLTGLRQGCMLSPWLFTMYINELVSFFKEEGVRGIYLGNDIDELLLLLFADDLTLCDDTVVGLQRKLNLLETFCKKWDLVVSLEKSKIVVFKNGGKLSKHEKWYYAGERVEVVSYYKYLGVIFSCRLNWSTCCRTLAAQAHKATSMVKRCLSKCDYDPTVAFKLFDSMISPILCYSAEIWGTEIRKDIERVHTKFCKWLLRVNTKTCNVMALGECGRYQMYTVYMVKPVKYWLRLLKMSNNRYPHQCYKLMYELDRNGRSNWASSVRCLLHKFGFNEVWLNQGVGDERQFLYHLRQKLRDSNIQEWKQTMCESGKCRFYNIVKNNLSLEPYISCLSYRLKCTLTRFRCSQHSLQVELGRRNKIPLEQRLCTVCNLAEIEDEYHFMLICPMYQDLRNNFLPRQYYVSPSQEHLGELFRADEVQTIRNLAIYIRKSLNVRDELLVL
jgi:hypothetical protein